MRAQLRAISPVIATVIIVAVALAIAVAVVGWLMGLWSGLAGGTPQITMTNPQGLTNKSLTCVKVYMINQGTGSDRILQAEILWGGKTGSVAINETGVWDGGLEYVTDAIIVPANYKGWVYFCTSQFNNTVVGEGDSIMLRIFFEKSGTQTIQGVVIRDFGNGAIS